MSRLTAAVGVAGAVWLGAVGASRAEPERAVPDDGQGAGAAEVFEKDVVEVEPAAAPIDLVIVDNRLGDVRIEGHDGPGVVIHAFKRGPDEDALDRLKVSLVPDPDGPVRIGTRLAAGPELAPLPAGSVRIDLVIQAPRAASVRAEVWNGHLAVAGMDNGADLHANRGDLEVRNCSGRIVTSIAVGRQQFQEVVGDIEAQGITGDLDLQVVRGQQLDATVHRGQVVGRRVRSRNVSIRVTNGDIRFTGALVEGGRYQFATYRGDVDIAFARGPAVELAARARSGRVELPRVLRPVTRSDGWVTGEFPDAAPAATVRIVTATGAIRVASF